MAGIMWLFVGGMLISYAYNWLTVYDGGSEWLFGALGLIAAVLIHRFGFSRIVDKNLTRIMLLSGRPCAFSFISWKSYLLILVMISFGMMLRHSTIPREYLSVLYIGIGLALVFSSFRYFKPISI